MERKRMSPSAKLGWLTLAIALFLQLAPATRQASAVTNPCPHVCGYTFVGGCCISDPKYDCYDYCP